MKLRNSFIIFAINIVVAQSPFVEYSPLPENSSFVIILDKSGSMSGEAIANAKQAAQGFVATLHTSDRVGLIAFSHEIDIAVPITTSRSDLHQGISNIVVGGSTKLYDALAVGWKLLKNESSKKNNRLSHGW